MARNDRMSVTPGVRYTGYMPHSEACMHMQVAGRRMWFELSKAKHPSVQLYHRPEAGGELVPFSSPITVGEAGIFHQGTNEEYFAGEGFYCYPEQNGPALLSDEEIVGLFKRFVPALTDEKRFGIVAQLGHHPWNHARFAHEIGKLYIPHDLAHINTWRDYQECVKKLTPAE